jgi:hypothetical protein
VEHRLVIGLPALPSFARSARQVDAILAGPAMLAFHCPSQSHYQLAQSDKANNKHATGVKL